MKTSKIITAFTTLNLVLFMSISAIGNSSTLPTGDIIKSGVKKHISTSVTASKGFTATVEAEYNYLRFNVNTFIPESEITELPASSLDYLRFDVNKFADASETGINELPESTGFDYLRFDVNEFVEYNSDELTELPLI